MQENTSRHAVGIDIGTTTVRCVVAHIDGTTGVPTIVGVGSALNNGMRKGTVVNLTGPAQAIDDALLPTGLAATTFTCPALLMILPAMKRCSCGKYKHPTMACTCAS